MAQKVATVLLVVVLLCVGFALNYQGGAHNDSKPTPPAPVSTSSAPPADEAIYGDPAAKTTVTIGYTWTAKLQVDPSKLIKIIDIAKDWAKAPGRSVQVVCVDIPAADLDHAVLAGASVGVKVSAGASLNGNPGEDVSPSDFETFLKGLK